MNSQKNTHEIGLNMELKIHHCRPDTILFRSSFMSCGYYLGSRNSQVLLDEFAHSDILVGMQINIVVETKANVGTEKL